MKVLTVVTDLAKGGTQRVAQIFANSFEELGAESKILCVNALGPRVDELNDQVVALEQLNEVNLALVSQWNPDVVHIHSTGLTKNDLEPLWPNLSAECSVIDTNVFSEPTPWEEHVDHSLQLGSWAEWLYLLRGGKREKSIILPNPVDVDSFNPATIQEVEEFRRVHNIPPEAKLIGRIGQSSPAKWSLMLIDVFDELSRKSKDLYLLLVNPPDNILERARTSSFSQNIIHIDRIIGDKALSVAYSAMDIFTHIAERGESFGLVLTESILCETPVVTLQTPWGDNCQGEVLGHLKGGLVVHSKEGFKKAIQALLTNKLDVNLEKEGRNHVINKFDRIKLSRQILSLHPKQDQIKPVKGQRLMSLLNDSYDKPTLLTRVFLSFNNDTLRRLTIYTTGYKPIRQIFKSVASRIQFLF